MFHEERRDTRAIAVIVGVPEADVARMVYGEMDRRYRLVAGANDPSRLIEEHARDEDRLVGHASRQALAVTATRSGPRAMPLPRPPASESRESGLLRVIRFDRERIEAEADRIDGEAEGG